MAGEYTLARDIALVTLFGCPIMALPTMNRMAGYSLTTRPRFEWGAWVWVVCWGGSVGAAAGWRHASSVGLLAAAPSTSPASGWRAAATASGGAGCRLGCQCRGVEVRTGERAGRGSECRGEEGGRAGKGGGESKREEGGAEGKEGCRKEGRGAGWEEQRGRRGGERRGKE